MRISRGQALSCKTTAYLIAVLGIYAKPPAKLVMQHLNVTHTVYILSLPEKSQALVPYGLMHIQHWATCKERYLHSAYTFSLTLTHIQIQSKMEFLEEWKIPQTGTNSHTLQNCICGLTHPHKHIGISRITNTQSMNVCYSEVY